MIKYSQKTIDGVAFHVTQHPAFQALKLKAKLARLLGPGFSGLLLALAQGKAKKAADMDIAELAPAFGKLAETLDPDAFANACLELMANTLAVEGKQKFELVNPHAFDQLFTGRMGLLYKAMHHVLEVNDFFGLGGIGKVLGARASTPDSKPDSLPPKER